MSGHGVTFMSSAAVDLTGAFNIGFIASDVIHNLRATLDNLVWEITPPLARSRQTAFPVREEPGQFDKDPRVIALKGIDERVVDAIRRVQPFVTEAEGGLRGDGGKILKKLDDFWNGDKHCVPVTMPISPGPGTTISAALPDMEFDGTLAELLLLPDGAISVTFQTERVTERGVEVITATMQDFVQMHHVVGEIIRRVWAART